MSAATKRIRAYLQEMSDAGVQAQKVAGWKNPIMRQDLEEVLASRADYQDAFKGTQKARQAEYEELREALQLKDASWEGMIRQVHALQQQETGTLLRAQDAEKQYRILRGALREVCAAVLPAYKDSDAGQQLSALHTALSVSHEQKGTTVDASGSISPDVVAVLQAALNQSRSIDNRIVLNRQQAWQLLRRAKTAPAAPAPASPGVQAISEARAYQMRVHPSIQTNTSAREERRRELLAAAVALLHNHEALYPFGTQSFRATIRRGGVREQYAHAGACIAALIDLLPPAPQAQPGTDYRERRARDHAAYPGEAGDLF